MRVSAFSFFRWALRACSQSSRETIWGVLMFLSPFCIADDHGLRSVAALKLPSM